MAAALGAVAALACDTETATRRPPLRHPSHLATTGGPHPIHMPSTDPMTEPGPLIAIGGNEARSGDMPVLRETLRALPGDLGRPPCVAVLTAASQVPRELWATYRDAFETLGAGPEWLDIRSRDQGVAEQALDLLARADLLFMTGGDQQRLARIIDGTAVHRLIARRHRDGHLGVAGSSAGASVLGALMPGGDGDDDDRASPYLSDAALARGLGLLHGAVIDQHFSQRRRLSRLLNLIGRQGGLVGLGVDEDTAAVIRPGRSLAVVGRGSVTLVDCRFAQRSSADAAVTSLRQLALHRVAAGATLQANPTAGPHADCDGIAVFLP